MFFRVLLGLITVVLIRSPAHAEWSPLIASDMFTGIQTDVLTAATGILSVIIIVLGIGILMRVLSR